jgi:hypothetical protein
MLIAYAILPSQMQAQVPPTDFSFSATAGGTGRWRQQERITIDSARNVRFVRYENAVDGATLADTSFIIGSTEFQNLWNSIVANGFTGLNSRYADTTVQGGGLVIVSVRANGSAHQVMLLNASQNGVQSILDDLNSALPATARLHYTPPSLFNIVPADPCAPPPGLSITPQNIAPGSLAAKKGGGRSVTPTIAHGNSVVGSHPGTVVAYTAPLDRVVQQGKAKFTSKGAYNGDAVSISIDNSNPLPQPSIEIQLYLEFWGPEASPAIIQNIVNDIQQKWAGAKQSDGTPVHLSVISRLNPDATSPPGTPGFHQIQLVAPDAVRSSVSGGSKVFGINYGTASGTWETFQKPGIYAHEVGHLMGLPDQYDDWVKQPDGSWVSDTEGLMYSNTADFAQYAATREPGRTANSIAKYLANKDLYSVAKAGHENDLMADNLKPLLQSDIDKITSNPGLLVNIPSGDVLANRNSSAQNLVVTHSDDLFVPPGGKRTLNGIFASCIDGHKLQPSTGDVFDLVPSLTSWGGYGAAAQLQSLVSYIDTSRLYCGLTNDAQKAIWRLTDNEPATAAEQAVLLGAGLTPGTSFIDFPHLTGAQRSDTTAVLLVPNELFSGRITPRFLTGSIGTPATFRGTVSSPSATGFSSSFTWLLTGPGSGSIVPTSAGDSTAFTPVKTGLYELGLNVSVTDSSSGVRKFPGKQKGYLVVPDAFTETFDHSNLTDRFPWKTYGEAPWIISSAQSVTGGYSVEGGGFASDVINTLTSTLEMHVSLAADSIVTFFVKSASANIADGVAFSIDSVLMSYTSGYTDWALERDFLPAGTHTLQWTVSQLTDAPGKFWIDNIFFPSKSVVTEVAGHQDMPGEFALLQNYPNPFNPSTTIKYELPTPSEVRMSVYDILGREVSVLVNERQQAGYHEVKFDGNGLSSGVYFYRIEAGSFIQTRKLMLLR